MAIYRLKGTSGAVANQAWSLEDKAVIGSAPDCAVQVDGDVVAPQHAELTVGDRTISLRVLETGAEVHVNGVSVVTGELASGDEIRIGNCRWLLQAPGLKPERVLTEEAVRRRPSLVPWLIAGVLATLAVLAWWLGLMPF